MNKIHLHKNIVSSRVCSSSLCDLENIIKANLLNRRLAFVVHRELKTILPFLILSRKKQKLLIEPTEYNDSACNDLTVLSCDLHNLFEVVRGLGMPFVG
jgi:hypothetical protein